MIPDCVVVLTVAAALAQPEAEIVALLHLAPLVEHLRDRPSEARSEIAARVIEASLQADEVIAALAQEQADVLELRTWIEARQGAQARRLNIAVGILSAGTAVGTGLTISNRTARAGAIVGTVAGVLGAAATLLAVRTPGPSRPPITVSSTMLSPYFDQGPSSSYPPLVWRYLAAGPPGAAETRRQRLLTEWRRLGRLPPEGTAAARKKIGQLVGTISPSHPISADVLSDRLRMLDDVRAQTSSLKLALGRTLVAMGAFARRSL